MKEKLLRVGTTYIPVTNVELSLNWYVNKLGAELNFKDEDKAIINFANQSFFLVKSQDNQTLNFFDFHGEERFSITFEVNGLHVLESIHSEFIEKEILVGEIENRGHAGKNFVFYDLDGNKFDAWSELSPIFKEKYLI
ncbi:VOC family protein [Bacillus mobilis]|uniref:Glyoxalase n=2 Tax=Bacillus cereus group TaxID=86661 RepID=A0A1C4F4G9_BACCE|nr:MULTISPECIES: VOC family protein [Bacillus cereus group]MCC2463671.1 VOC family protein [Bacillus mobilis]MCU5431890.1 VOC family protein [Bacillus mobilis]MCU5594925.1 VOC family protein [Bacillus mobilis]MCU5737082.1 VOC family protein [Bacillus mobilis]MCU9559332.1 VOC family protein [Bacillus mobilis]